MSFGLVSVVMTAMAFFGFIPSTRAADKEMAGMSVSTWSIPAPEQSFAPEKELKQSEIILAGGCFWCTEAVFQSLKGVTHVESGYTGGSKEDATYEKVSRGSTNHAEAVRVVYNPQDVGLDKILQVFFGVAHNPTQLNRQGNDVGRQYRSAIFVTSKDQQEYISDYIDVLNKGHYFEKPIVTTIEPFTAFYKAEEYHQDYAAQNPENPYIQSQAQPKVEKLKKMIKANEQKHSDAADFFADRKKALDPMQCHVTQDDGTEPAFNNAYWNHKEEGIYVDIVSGEPLFSSTDKYDSGSGWPSFTQPIEAHNIVKKADNRYGMERVEVRSKKADSHLGHVFTDGPRDKGGLRYCINSASLRFVPKADLEKEGYGAYRVLFEAKGAQ